MIWAGGYLVDGLRTGTFDTDTGRAHFDDSRRFLRAGLSFLVAVAGYALVIRRRQGPLATAGVLAGAIGVALSWYGGRYGRRFTTWAAAVVLGIVVIVAGVVPDSATAAGVTLIVVGVAVVAAAEFLVRALREPPELPAVAEEAAPAG